MNLFKLDSRAYLMFNGLKEKKAVISAEKAIEILFQFTPPCKRGVDDEADSDPRYTKLEKYGIQLHEIPYICTMIKRTAEKRLIHLNGMSGK
jgi:hypothetical protein